jgi:hypothetical protein
MRIKQTIVYQYDELSDKAKEKARDWYRDGECDDDYWSEGVIDDAAAIAEFLGLDINQTAYKTMGGETRYKPTVYFSGFWSQGGGACVEGTWRARDVKADKLKEYAPQDQELHRIVDGLAEIAKEYPDGSFTVKHSGHYSHSGCTRFNIELPCEAFDEAEYDSPEHTRLDEKISNDGETLKELARDFMNWIYKQLKEEWDYQNSDEQVEESIRANEYEFLEDGTRA